MLIERKQYELPTEDVHQLKVVEIGELKKVQTKFGIKDKFTVKVEVLDQKSEESPDEPILVFATFAPSLGEKSNLAKFLKRLGYNFSEGTFEMDDILGVRFSAAITHNEGSNGNTYANLVTETIKPSKVAGGSKPAHTKQQAAAAAPMTDEDIPF